MGTNGEVWIKKATDKIEKRLGRSIYDVIFLIALLLGVGTIFLGAGLEYNEPHSLTSGTCFGVGGTLIAVAGILSYRHKNRRRR